MLQQLGYLITSFSEVFRYEVLVPAHRDALGRDALQKPLQEMAETAPFGPLRRGPIQRYVQETVFDANGRVINVRPGVFDPDHLHEHDTQRPNVADSPIVGCVLHVSDR